MKKVFLLIICVLCFMPTVSLGRDEGLANKNKRGLHIRSIEQLLRLNADEIDLATAVLIISEQWSDNVRGRKYLTQLDNMALEIRDRIKASRLGAKYEAIGIINKYLFEEMGFESVSEANDPNDLFLHTVLERKRGYCLSLSVLYLSIGERIGLPLYGVVVPGHFFVRYDDGRIRFNIETTNKGGYADDEHYIDKFKVPDGDSIYMNSLDSRQTLGCFFNNLGNSYSEVDNIDGALKALERAVEINPSLSESRVNLGNVYLKKGRINDAVDEYKAALAVNPDEAKTHNNLGNAYAEQGRLDKAISEYLYSLKLDPNFTDVYTNLAVAYGKKGLFNNAVSILKRAIALEPKNDSFYNQLGNVYSETGDYEKAVSQYKKALRFKPDSAAVYYGLGLCYTKMDKVDDAIAAYEKALAAEPEMVAALANLGNVYFNEKKYDAAIEQYKNAVRIRPNDSLLHYNLGAAYSNNEDYESAAAEYGTAVEIDPQMGDAHNGLAVAFYNLKKYELAWEHIKKAEQLGSEVAEDLLKAIKKKLH